MKKLLSILLICSSLVGLGQTTKIKIKQLENPATYSLNLGVQTLSAGAITGSDVIAKGTLSVTGTSSLVGNALFSNSVGIGALPTSSLSSFRMVKGTSTIDIGEALAGNPAIWLDNVTPSSTNYSIKHHNTNETFDFNTAGEFNFRFNSSTVLSNLNNTTGHILRPLRVGSVVAPTETLSITGNASISSSLSLGGAGLTGGNTGTVAVLSDAVFPMTFNCNSASTLADNATYYIGNTQIPQLTVDFGKVRIPSNCTLVSWEWNTYINGAASTGETSTLSINGTTNYTLSSVITFSSGSGTNTFSATGLSQDFSASDTENIKLVCANFATNPTLLFMGLTLWFKRRT